jgi:hypothetical protein
VIAERSALAAKRAANDSEPGHRRSLRWLMLSRPSLRHGVRRLTKSSTMPIRLEGELAASCRRRPQTLPKSLSSKNLARSHNSCTACHRTFDICSIKKIELVNFMTHQHVIMYPTARVNFVLGANGRWVNHPMRVGDSSGRRPLIILIRPLKAVQRSTRPLSNVAAHSGRASSDPALLGLAWST